MFTRSSPAAVVDTPPATEGDRLTEITGRAVPYNTPTDIGNVVETIAPRAFRESLALTPAIPLLTYHDRLSDPVGYASRWEERSDGLHGTWQLDDSERAREVGRLVQCGMLRFFSIGFQFTQADLVWTVDPSSGRDHVTVKRARLVEVSLVSTPAYAGATVTGIRSAPAMLADMGRRLGAPLLPAAITGTPDQVRTAADLVMNHVSSLGRAAVVELEDLASGVTDPTLGMNLARAAAALSDADPVRLSRVYLDEIRSDLGMPPPGAAPRPPSSRRRPYRR